MKAKTIDINHQLIQELKRGSESATTQIYQQYAKAMYNTLIRITGSTEEAQDLLQDAFIKAFQNIEKYRGESTFGAWLKRIVVNTGLEQVRKKKIKFEELNENFDVSGELTENFIPDPVLIHEEIKKLPNGSRTVLSLYLLEGYSHQEIADELDISVSTSKTQYMRAKLLLREKLKYKIYE